IHKDYYEDIPLLPWKHGTESCKYIFGVACQFRPNFTFLEILQIVPKISQYFRSIQLDHLLFRKEKTVHEDYSFNEYEEINLLDDDLEFLCYWPSDINIDDTINIGYKRAIHLVRHLEINSISSDVYYFNINKKISTSQLEDF
ncbi:5995_t:CDS:2, partial [Dentiscutata erythropus]